MKDVIIVGSGIAACSLAWQLQEQGKSFVIITDRKKGSSTVAAGVYNPMVLKRFTAVWKAQEQLDVMNRLYDSVHDSLSIDFRNPITVARRFHDDKESKTWIKKSIREDLSPFMQQEIRFLDLLGIDATAGYGFVNGTGWVDTIGFMNSSLTYFESNQQVVYHTFDYNTLVFNQDHVAYRDISSLHVIFAEGYRMLHNPYFNQLPLQGNKGEVLIIKIPGLQLNHIIKSSVFLMPYKEDLFWVGATYDRDDLEDVPTQIGRDFLISRLERFLHIPYEVIDHKQGIRPTTIDRRPLVGKHAVHKNCWVFNGMGSRSVLLAPWAAQQLIQHIFDHKPLNQEIDIARFDKL